MKRNSYQPLSIGSLWTPPPLLLLHVEVGVLLLTHSWTNKLFKLVNHPKGVINIPPPLLTSYLYSQTSFSPLVSGLARRGCDCTQTSPRFPRERTAYFSLINTPGTDRFYTWPDPLAPLVFNLYVCSPKSCIIS